MLDPFDKSTAPDTEPTEIVGGYYVAWRREIDVDDALFTVTYRFNSVAGSHTATVTGTRNGAFWEFEMLGSALASWVSGEYRWDLLVVRNSDSEDAVLDTGTVRFFGTDDDRRDHAEIMLAKIESLLQGRADADVESYSIKNRSLTKMSVKELTYWRDYYANEVGRKVKAGAAKSNTIRVRWI